MLLSWSDIDLTVSELSLICWSSRISSNSSLDHWIELQQVSQSHSHSGDRTVEVTVFYD